MMSNETEQKIIQELIGAKAELTISSGVYKGNYPSRLEECDDKGLLGVAHPTNRGALLPALRSAEMIIKIMAASCFYQSKVRVIRSTVDVAFPLLWVKLLIPLEKIQRRMFVRVPCALKGELFALGGGERAGAYSSFDEWITIKMENISLGGVAFSVQPGDLSYCREGGRYLMRVVIDNVPLFVVIKLLRIARGEDGQIVIGVSYEGLPVAIEKIMREFIRRQELLLRV